MSQQEAQETVDKMKVTLKTFMHTFHGIDTLGNKLGSFLFAAAASVSNYPRFLPFAAKKDISK